MCIQAEVNAERVFWDEEFSIIGESLELWNENVIPWMHGSGLMPQDKRNHQDILKWYKAIAHKIATSRGWKYDKESDSYVTDLVTAEESQMVMEELARRSNKQNDEIYEAI